MAEKMEIIWKNVGRDGLPEPDENKTYFVWGFYLGVGQYRYGSELATINGKTQFIKTDKPGWRLDYDNVGHEDQVTDYFEVPFPRDCT
jgi:hypothetical protein